MSRGENSYTVQYNHDRRPKKYKWSLEKDCSNFVAVWNLSDFTGYCA